jgi:16S rRNA (guanine527-N7)-methyltransferase
LTGRSRPRTVRHPHGRTRVTRLARGPGKPDREPDESGKTDADRATDHDAGSGSRRRQRVRPQEGCLSRQHEPLPTRVEDLAPLPPAYARALDDGLRDLGLTLDPAIRGAIDDHVRLLLAWTTAINLTAIRDPAAAATAHVVDSLSAVPLLRVARADAILDLGSGGGFPGLPVALALPAARALLVESVGKKAAFLRAVVEAVGAGRRVAVAAVRAEELARDPAHRERWPVVTARAVASLDALVRLAFPLVRPGGRLIAWKRGDLASELETAARATAALGGGTIEVVDPALTSLPDHRLVVVRKAGHVPEPRGRARSGRRRP